MNHQSVTLQQVAVASDANLLGGDANASVTDISHDSRRVGPGALFVAIKGALLDAHRFIPQVMEAGALGVISELARPADFHGAWLQVSNVRRAVGLLQAGSSPSFT